MNAGRPTSTDSTGGRGFNFADQVAADLLLLMLLARPLRGMSEGHIEEIHFECGAKGWRFDDWLVTCLVDGAPCYRAYSCKSNHQFSKTKAPPDAVVRLWQQLDASDDQNPFRSPRDQLVLVTTPLDPSTRANLDHLLRTARVQDVDTFVANASQGLGQSRRVLLHSFSRDTAMPDSRSAWRALRAFSHHGYDYLQDGSQSLQHSLELARAALDAPTAQVASDLWNDLAAIASKARENGEVLRRHDLIERLRPRHQLQAHPDYTSDLSKLRRHSGNAQSHIRTVVGTDLTLARSPWLQQIAQLGLGFFLTAVGDSGSGKSGLVKLYSRSHAEAGRLIWVNADVFNESLGLESALALQHPLSELLDEGLSSQSLIVVDAAERASNYEAEVRLAGFIRQVVNRPADRRPTVVLTVQRAEKDRLLSIVLPTLPEDMRRWIMSLEGLLGSELEQIAAASPSLRPYLANEASRRALSNLKTLDLLLRGIGSAQLVDPTFRVTEEWIAKLLIESALRSLAKPIEAREAAVQLAYAQATHGQYALPQTKLEPLTLSWIDPLVTSGLVRHDDDRFTFDHDIIGDWLRASAVPEEPEDLQRYIAQHLHQPVWMRAVRTRLRWLAERSPTDFAKRFVALTGAKPDGQLLDMLLDGLLLATNSSELLTACRTLLLDGPRPLLQHALTRALHSCTEPDSRTRELAAESQKFSDVLISAHVRRPRQVVVEPLIEWLAANQPRALELAHVEVASLCRVWLSSAPRTLPSRKAAAGLAIEVVEHAFAIDALRGHRYRDDSHVFEIYAALCLAVIDEPDRAKAVLRALAGRSNMPLKKRPPPERKPWRLPAGRIPFPSLAEFALEDEVDILAWECGPKWNVPDSFREFVVNQGYALTPILVTDSRLAAELILAVLVRAPGRRARPRHYASDLDLEIESDVRDYPPFYDRGPFHQMFACSPDIGVDLVVQLSRFAYARWLDECADDEEEARSINGQWTPASVRVRQHLLYAHRDVGRWPHILVSALMALEKHLTIEADNGNDIRPQIERLLETDPNEFLLGVCISVAKKHPALLSDRLLSLAADEELLLADYMQILQGEGHQVSGVGVMRGSPTLDQTRQWHGAPYRKQFVAGLLANTFSTSAEVEKVLNQAARQWGALRPLPPTQERIEWLDRCATELRAIFDSANWRQTDDHTRTFHQPEELEAVRQHAAQVAADSKEELISAYRYQQRLEEPRALSEEEIGHVLGVLQSYVDAVEVEGGIEQSANRVSIVMHCICLLAERAGHEKFQASLPLTTRAARKAALTVEDPRYRDELTSTFWFEPFARTYAHLFRCNPSNLDVRRTLGECLAFARGKVLATIGHAVLVAPALPAEQVMCALALLADVEAIDMHHRMYRYGDHEPLARERCNAARTIALQRFADGSGKPPATLQHLVDAMNIKAGLPPLDQLDWTVPIDRVVAFANWTDSVQITGASHPYYAISEQIIQYVVAHYESPVPTTGDADERHARADTTTDGERRALEMVAVAQLCRWRETLPLLELRGLLANASLNEHHIEEYLDGLFEFAPRVLGDRISELFPGFVTALHASLEATPGWSSKQQWIGHAQETLWCGAIGLTRWRGAGIWQRYSATTVDSLRPVFAAWAGAHLHRPSCAVAFLRMMQMEQFQVLLLDCIVWLDQAQAKGGEKYWDSYSDSPVEDAATFLEKCWNERRNEIAVSPALSASFAKLVGLLSAQHNKVAMTLWDKLGG